MAPRMPKTIDLGFGTIKVNRTMTSVKLDAMARKLYPDDKRQEMTLGLWVYEHLTIYIAKDLKPRAQWQLLNHELAEAIMAFTEFPYRHDKVLLIESLITHLMNNKKFVQGYWRSQHAASD